MVKISELATNMSRINLEATVAEITPIKEFTKFGRKERVATAILEDDSGKISLTLWDDQVDIVKPGDKIRIVNGYTKEYQGEMQLHIGKYGSFEILS